ncbi:MAG: hypothetical protein Tsb0021_02600 [Chlamydiales bacterium]
MNPCKLIKAVSENDYSLAKELLEAGLDPNQPYLFEVEGLGILENQYPIMEASENTNLEMLHLFVKYDAKADVLTRWKDL